MPKRHGNHTKIVIDVITCINNIVNTIKVLVVRGEYYLYQCFCFVFDFCSYPRRNYAL